MKRILITGENSYLGVCLRNYLQQWPECYSVDSISVRSDCWKEKSFRGYDAVYHAAAIVHMEQSKDDPAQAELYDRVNACLPVEVAAKAKDEGVGQFVFLSTASVYGLTAPFGKTVTICRDTPLEPKDNYGISKAKAEAGLLKMADEHFAVAILRPPMIYGKGCKGNYQTLAKMAKKLPAFPYVKNRRSMLHVDNLCELVRKIVDNGDGGIFCPQNREYVNTCDMMQAIAAANGKKIALIPGFGWALKMLSGMTSKVDKAFGSLCYDMELSRYKEDYCITDFSESIQKTEG